MRGLKNKRVLVTGGASGIGAATVKRFLEENSRVVLFDLDAGACERIKKELPSITGTIITDVSDPDSVSEAFTKLDELMGGVDILINNAGISIRHENFVDISPREWQKVLNVNLNGVFYVAQQAAKRMVAQGSGVIINMGCH
jgi:NAD(P)-dependent dehydrogenase (short-subunit alcohol dehydrogenase family)